jgi:hypothetical protein
MEIRTMDYFSLNETVDMYRRLTTVAETGHLR